MFFTHNSYNPPEAKFAEENGDKHQVDQQKVVVNGIVSTKKSGKIRAQ
tara:strand:- start:2134 stop:2277 length:144 start_codon:yes stop_codon:yes gene_type:complete